MLKCCTLVNVCETQRHRNNTPVSKRSKIRETVRIRTANQVSDRTEKENSTSSDQPSAVTICQPSLSYVTAVDIWIDTDTEIELIRGDRELQRRGREQNREGSFHNCSHASKQATSNNQALAGQWS